eukprot:s33_g27.t3
MEYWRRSSFLSVLGGYSPVDVKVNESVVICDYDPAQRKSFRHKFVASAFTLPAGTLRLGQNCLRISTREVGSPYGLLSAKLVNLLEAFLPTTMLAPDDDLVFLNIYNLGKSNAVQSLNGIFKNVGLGAFHCAVQVFGTEWSYGGWPEGSPCDRHDTGVWSCLPRMSVSHTFHEAPVQVKPQVLALLSCEAVVMGSVTISEEELVELICSLMQEWPMSEYDLLNKNCCHFCEELCELLGVGPLPSRVKKLAGLGSTLNESAAMMAEAASKVRADIVGVGVVASSLLVQAAVGTVSALGTADVAASGDSHRPSAEQNKLHLRDYLHRAGRTARFGEPGKVTSLVKKGDKYLAKAIERCVQLGKPINELQKPQSPRKVVRTRKWSRTIQLLCLLEFGPIGMAVLAPGNMSAVFKDVEAYNTAIGAYGRQSRWLQSLCLLSALLRQGLRATMVSRSAALGACSKASRWQAGLGLLRSIAAAGQQANAVPFNAAISGVGSVLGSWHRSRHLLDDMRWHTVLPTVVTLGGMIASCGLHALWSSALRSVAMMQELHVQPDLVARNSLSDAAAAAANWPLASKLVEETREARLRRDAVGMTTLLQAFAEGAHWNRAIDAWAGFAQDGMSRNVIQLNSVTNSLGRGQNWEQATQIIRSIPEPLRPDAITLAASLAACSEAVQWEAAMQLFVLDFSSGAPALTASCATTAMAAARRAGHWRRVLGISAALGRWQVTEDLVCFNERLAAFADSRRWRSAVAALKAQASQSLRPDTTALNTCLAAFGSTWRKLLLHLQEASAQGSADAVSFHCAASSCAAAGEVGAALRLVEQGRSQGLDAEPVVLAAAALASAPPQLLAALRAPCLDRLRRTDAKESSGCPSTRPKPECSMCLCTAGALGELMERHPRAAKYLSREERGLPARKPYSGGLR